MPVGMFYDYDYGVVLKNSGTGETIPDAISEMSCGS